MTPAFVAQALLPGTSACATERGVTWALISNSPSKRKRPAEAGRIGLHLNFLASLERQPERELDVALGSRNAAGDDSEVAVSSVRLGIAKAHIGLAEHREVEEID